MAAAEARAIRGRHRITPATGRPDGTGPSGTGPSGLRIIAAAPAMPDERDRAQAWLRSAMAALAVLAAAAAAVSWDAQYVMVRSVKHPPAMRASGALASQAHAKARGATIRRDLIGVAGRIAHHGCGHLTIHLPAGWHREHEWASLFEAACGPPAAAA